jgi:hypothetical protein
VGKSNNENRWALLVAIAAILGTCIAGIALIPAFGQWLQVRPPEQKIIERERVVTVHVPVVDSYVPPTPESAKLSPEVIERIVTVVVPAKNVIAVDNTNKIQQLTFCNESEFDSSESQCTVSRQVFSGVVKAVYVSWQTNNPSQNFTRIWYLNGREIKRTTSQAISAKYEVETLNSLRKGNYKVDLYVGGQLIGNGTFTIQ